MMSRKQQFTIRLELEALETRTVPSTFFDVAKAITNSWESENRQVVTDYATFLHRAPVQAEVNGWFQEVRRGMSYETLDANFLASAESSNNTAAVGPPGW